MRFKTIILFIAVLTSIDLLGQQYFDLSANIGTQTATFRYNELPLSSPNINKQYIMGFSPAFQLEAFYQKEKCRLGLVYQSREMILKTGFSIKNIPSETSTSDTISFINGGTGLRQGFLFREFAIQGGYIIQSTKRFEQSLNFQVGYFYLRKNDCLSNPTNNQSGGGISSSSCGAVSSGDYTLDSLGNIIDNSMSFTKDFHFIRNDNIYLGVNYNLKFFVKPYLFFNLNLSYNQGLFNIYTNDSEYKYINYQTGHKLHFEHQIKSNLSHFSSVIGIGYRYRD